MNTTNKKLGEKPETEIKKKKSFQGAVFYIDILGIEALTSGKVKLTDKDYIAWGIEKKEEQSHHSLAWKLLYHFRQVLLRARKQDASKRGVVQYAQLSDCAFIWSKETGTLLNAVTNVMWDASKSGLLCRAGLSYGNILQPTGKEAGKLGRFIIGKAVTNAVRNECSGGKGARIFCDKTIRDIQDIPAEFKDLINPSTYEYQWYLHPLQKTNDSPPKKLTDLRQRFMECPKFGWNRNDDKGKEQIDCTVECLRILSRNKASS